MDTDFRSYDPMLVIKRNWSSAKTDQQDSEELRNDTDTAKVGGETQSKADAEPNEEIVKLNEAIADMKDKYQRSLAENENVRKRLRKEITDAKHYAVQGFCKDLLSVADILSTAVDSVPEEIVQKNGENHKQWTDFYDGVKMTKSELLSVFKRHGLVPFTPEKGDKFDPNIHEAMFQAPVPDLEPGLVAHVQSSGYMLRDRTLRPAQVGVSK